MKLIFHKIKQYFCPHNVYVLKSPMITTRDNPGITYCRRCGKELNRNWQYEDKEDFVKRMST